jgi:hypothetical protein
VDEARVLLDDFLQLLPTLFSLFDRSAEVDEAVHKALANYFKTTSTVASEEEDELINEVVEYEEQDWKRIPGTVQEPVEYFQVLAKGKSMLSKIGRSKSSADADSDGEVEGAWGKATTNIDISADRCLAYFWHHMNYGGNARFETKNGQLLRMQVDEPDCHTTFIVTSLKMPFPGVHNRVFPTKWVWRREKSGTLVAGLTFKGTRPPSPCPAPPSPSHLISSLPRIQRVHRAGHRGRRAGRRLHAGHHQGLFEVQAPRRQRVPCDLRLPDDSGWKSPCPGHELRGEEGLGHH